MRARLARPSPRRPESVMQDVLESPGALPPGVVARGAHPTDVDAVVAVIRAAEELDQGAPMTTRAEVTGDWQRPSVDLATDVVVVERHGHVVAYGEQFLGRAFVHVHPDARGLGIGSALAAWTESHARARGLAHVGQAIATTATAATSLLLGRGYRPRWESWILQRSLDDDLPLPRPPAGMQVRSLVRPDDDEAVYELIDTAFSDWDQRDEAMSFADWRASYLDRDGMDPELVLVVVDGDRLVGAAVCMIDEGEGWIDQLAVVRSHRGRGLGRVLLHAAFRQFRERGLSTASLSTDSRTGALTLYEHVGMTVTESFTRLSLPLD